LKAEDILKYTNISPEDLDKLLRLRRVYKRDLYQIMYLENLCHSARWTADNYLSELDRDITGAAGLWLNQILTALSVSWFMPPECHLLNLMVHPLLWGLGLGRRMMADLLESCRKTGVNTVFLEVREGNTRAERLYKSLGFKITGRRAGYYNDGSGASQMTLTLPGGGEPRPVITRRRLKVDNDPGKRP
jgi:ribosomal-protein-alanine N-acetyltransferase